MKITVSLLLSAFAMLSASACVAPDQENSEETGEVASAICRTLVQGDRYYPEWISCCDRPDGTSDWMNPDHVHKYVEGTCSSWGIH